MACNGHAINWSFVGLRDTHNLDCKTRIKLCLKKSRELTPTLATLYAEERSVYVAEYESGILQIKSNESSNPESKKKAPGAEKRAKKQNHM